jgi:hypothetical protein
MFKTAINSAAKVYMLRYTVSFLERAIGMPSYDC